MTTFALIHGAGSDSWYWHLVEPELQAAGHDPIAVDLPCDDDSAGLTDYVDLVVDAVAGRDDVIVVAQSMGGFVAPLVAARVPATRLIVLVAAMVPAPGETGDEWWGNTGSGAARREQIERDGRDPDAPFDPVAEFLHDVDPALIEEGWAHVKEQSDTPFQTPWPLPAWPDVPTRFVLATKDRFFPPDFQRRVVRERLGIEPDEIDAGHLPALAKPRELAELLLRYEAETARR
ncbi:MAG TPA: alpha/beta hydrolase [Aeromicrobium sp.]|nr:alpha/beta hydrolase [Aeromicrobium sp.]